MSSKSIITHITPVGGNVFADLGFQPEEAAALKAESQRVISEKLAKTLAAMPNVGTDEDFVRDQEVTRLKGMVPAPKQPVPVEAMKIGGQTLKEMIEDGRE